MSHLDPTRIGRTTSRVRRSVSVLGATMLVASITGISLASAATVSSRVIAHLAPSSVTFTVTTFADTFDASSSDGICFDSTHHCSLRAAVEQANSLHRPVRIVLGVGTYPTNFGAISLASPYGITIVGQGASKTIINASGTGDRVFTMFQNGSTATITGVTITGGTAAASGPLVFEGGDIAVGPTPETLTLNSDVISHGQAQFGGGIFSDGTVWISNSTVTANTASSSGLASGGGINSTHGVLFLSNDTISSNSARSASTLTRGGGVYSGGYLEVTGSRFTNNSATTISDYAMGGGLMSDEQATVTNTTFTGNLAGPAVGAINQSAIGGGFYSCYSTTIMANLTISHNTATASGSGSAFGGGIDAHCGLATMTNPVITSNTVNALGTGSASGGGLAVGANNASDGAVLQISSATITNNVATSANGAGYGGGLSIDASGPGGAAIVTNSIISANRATSKVGHTGQAGGGAVFDAACGGSSFTNTTFQGNLAENGQGGALLDDACNDVLNGDRVISNRATGTATGSNTTMAEGVGGGIYFYDTGRVTNTVIANNVADLNGGGVATDDVVYFANDTIRSNQAPKGAGVYDVVSGVYRSVAIIDNAGTGPSSQGGGVWADSGSNYFNSTIAGNTAGSGAGFYMAAPGVVLKSSLVAGNHLTGTSTESDCFQVSGISLGSTGGNRLGDTSCTLVATGDRQGKADVGYNVLEPNGRVLNFNTTNVGSPLGKSTPATGTFVSLANSPDGQGYWVVSTKGYVFGYGSATSLGSAPGKPIVAITATPDGQGYWLLSSTGQVYPFGSAAALGSAPVAAVAMAATPDGLGYWIVGVNGIVYHFGSATALGSVAGAHLVGIAVAPDGQGYCLALTTGAVHCFGTAKYYGSTTAHVVGIASAPDGQGYWLLTSTGAVVVKGSELTKGSPAATFHLTSAPASLAAL